MHQRHITHPAGTFLTCSGCGREPMHIECAGRSTREGPSPLRSSSTRHQLECNRCGRTTARHDALADAVSEWGAAYAQPSLPLRVVPPRRRVA